MGRSESGRIQSRSIVFVGSLCMLALMGAGLHGASREHSRMVLGLEYVFLNALAMVACLWRARRFPPEARAWRVLFLGRFAALISNLIMAFRAEAWLASAGADSWYLGLQLISICLHVVGLLRLPLVPRHPEGFRLHLLGAALFGASLAYLIWSLGYWEQSDGLTPIDRHRLLLGGLRLALIGGILCYVLVDEPARLRGPVAWLFFGGVLGDSVILQALTRTLDLSNPQLSPLMPLSLLFPFSIAMAGFHRMPIDVPAGGHRKRALVVHLFLLLPFAASAISLLLTSWRFPQRTPAAILGFLVITTLLLLHQFALLGEIQSSRDQLDARVQERTRTLEETQGILLRTERMNSLGVLGAGLVHDINNLLTSITCSIETLRRKGDQGQTLDPDILDRVRAYTSQCADLTKCLLDYGRQASDTAERLDLAQIMEEDRSLLRGLLPRRITLYMECRPGSHELNAPREQVRQVLINLLSNAKDAIEGSGTIRISLDRDEIEGIPWTRLEVEDSGCGMSPEVVERIFEPFYTTKPPGKGTGLGLASLKVILEAIGGRVDVRSAPGAGTTFTVRLPLPR